MNSQYFSISSFGPYTSYFNDTSVNQFAVYGSIIYHKNGLNIELGSRVNSHKQYGTNATYTFNPSYQVNKNLRVFGSIASGFKAPSLYQLFSAYGNKDLEPEKATTFEAGVQHSSKQITNRLVYFYRDINNGIDFDNIQYSYFNITGQKVSGLEWEMNYKAGKRLVLIGNYTLLLSEENAQSRITTKDTSYNYLLRRPKHNINLTATYSFNGKWTASVAGKYVSDRYDAGGYQAADVKLDDYFLLNLNTAYTINSSFRVFVDLQNVLNTTFFDLYGYNAIPFLINGGVTITL
jgi:vitamin B12 transporter